MHWNPRTAVGTGRILTRVKIGRRIDNFGDLLGPLIVERIRQSRTLGDRGARDRRLLAVGSIMHLARDGDVVWGTGVNGKMQRTTYPRLDVRAVRGPASAAALRAAGIHVPDVYGDPALLLPRLWSDSELGISRGTAGTVLVPNLHDRAHFPPDALNPRSDVLACIRRIASADRVVASSLHGIVVAEAYGVPAVLVASASEPTFKYEDYYSGTGRRMPSPAGSWQEGLRTAPAPPLSAWSADALLDAFPEDLWEPLSPPVT
ncbi:polysaccharide pyruvyl transferase family protein [Microbacterium terrae]